MPAPGSSSPCPICGTRPRRKPGAPCNPCFAEQRKSTPSRANRSAEKHRIAAATVPDPVRYARPLKAKRYLITSAQNSTPVHEGFLKTLKVAAKHLGAQLVVVPFRYRNPSLFKEQRELDPDEYWASELEPFLFNVRRKLHPHLVLCGDVKIQPTASSPLTAFEALTGAESCIIGHPKMQLRSVPATAGRYPKILTTTGAVTKRNYSDTKAGKLGDFHHFLGAIVVELDGKRFHIRQVNADRTTGEFTDLDVHYTSSGALPALPALGLVLGDTHARMTCPRVDDATFGAGGIVETLNPQTLVFHDLFDGYSVNPHHAGDPFIAAAKHGAGRANAREEVEHAIEFVRQRAAGRRAVIAASNHDDFLARWIRNTDWRTNPANAKFYLETATAMLASVRFGPGGAEYADPFAYWVERLKGRAAIKCLAKDEPFKLGDIECSLHGHAGPNGARGSLKNLSRVGGKVIIGHAHTPGIQEGGYQVGTSTPLRLEYTHGPSSWQNAHCVVYATGKRSLLIIVDGTWRQMADVSTRKKAA